MSLADQAVDSKCLVSHSDVSPCKSIKQLLHDYNKTVKKNAKNIENVKLYTKQLLDNLDAIELSSIKNILVKHNVLQEPEDMTCSFCAEYTTKNKACFGQHNRRCKLNPKNIKE